MPYEQLLKACEGNTPFHYEAALQPVMTMKLRVLAIVNKGDLAAQLKVRLLESLMMITCDSFQDCNQENQDFYSGLEIASTCRHPGLCKTDIIGFNRTLSISAFDWPSVRWRGACDDCHRMRGEWQKDSMYNMRRWPEGFTPDVRRSDFGRAGYLCFNCIRTTQHQMDG